MIEPNTRKNMATRSKLLTKIPYLILCFMIVAGAHAQDLSGISICLDPGHGKGNRNAGPTGLREADINLRVSFFLKEHLKAAGIDTVLMTRTSDETNPTLSEREIMANRFGVTWFHSVHHNASGSSTSSARFTLLLYEELATRRPQWPGRSDVMSTLMARWLWKALRTSDWRVFGDFTFYGTPSYLGVLNQLQMPGELSEATFHDNRVEEAKMRNPDFLELEARGLFTAILDYFEAGKIPTGTINGIVRDADSGRPVNGALVRLMPGELMYVTDQWSNGIFAFHDLAPGNYTIEVEKDGYDVLPEAVEVVAHQFSPQDFSLVPKSPPAIVQIQPQDGALLLDAFQKLIFRFSRAIDPASLEAGLVIVPPVAGELEAFSEQRIFTFTPAYRFEFGTQYTVTLTDSVRDIYGNPLDGDGDGVGGDAFQFQFRTIPQDTTFPLVVDAFPPPGADEVFPGETLQVRFNRPLDPATVQAGHTVLLKLANTGIPLHVELNNHSEGALLSLLPQERLLGNRRYTVILRRSLQDTSGTPMAMQFLWSYNTEAIPGEWQEVSRFESGAPAFFNPLDDSLTSDILQDSSTFGLSDRYFASDSTSYMAHIVFESLAGRAMLHLVQPVRIGGADAIAVSVRGNGAATGIRFLFRDEEGETVSRRKVVDWTGWRTVSYRAGTDSLFSGNGSLVTQHGPLLWEGILIKAPASLATDLHFDDIYLLAPSNPVGITEQAAVPENFQVSSAYPNPVCRGKVAALTVSLTGAQHVRAAIYDMLGREVARIADGRLSGGRHVFGWNGNDRRGRRAPGGVYFFRIISGGKAIVRKFVLAP